MLKSKTVDGILATFKKTVADLLTVAKEQEALIEKKSIEIHQAMAAKVAASEERDRAVNAANKIQALLS